MANVNARASLSVMDDRGGGGTFLVHLLVPDTVTLASASTELGTLATLLATVSNCGIKVGEFTVIDESVAAAAGSDSNVGAGAVFDFSNVTNPSTFGLFVPSFLSSLIESNGTIDITAGAPAAFVAAMVGAVLGGRYTNAQYVANGAGLDAFLSNRKRRKRLRP